MKRLALFICTLLCANVLMAQFYDAAFYSGSLIYACYSDNDQAVVYGYNYENPPTNIVIPSTVSYEGVTYNVIGIDPNAFRKTFINNNWAEISCSSLTSVTIPNSVTSIGAEAFRNCSSLTSVTIPNSVTSIGNWAFNSCSSLTSVTIPNSVTFIGNGAFAYCSGLTSVTLPNNATIPSNAFIGAGEKTTIDSVIYCSDTLIIGNYTFIGTGFLTFYLNGNSYFSNNARVFDCDESKSGNLIIPSTISYNGTTNSVTSIGENAFFSCSGLTSVTIPNSVTSIGKGAFYNCSGLTSVTIPNSVTSIGKEAFCNCSGLTSVTIPNIIDSIRINTFYGCSSLTSVTIPNNIIGLSTGAFGNCSSLTTLNFNAINCSYFDNSFFNCPISTINIGDSVQRIPAGFAENSLITSIDIPNSVTSIGWYAFDGCSSLTSITIPNSVTSIGGGAFKDCSSLTSITIPNGVTSIEYNAFSGCSSLTSITIPNGVTSIEYNAFSGCSSLTSMTIDMNHIVGDTTFFVYGDQFTYESPFNIPSLQNLTIGENVTSIASGAFNNCSFLQNVTCLATTPPTLEDNTVFPYPNIASLTVPCGTLEAYSSATSFWNMFFAGRISENGYNVEVSVNDETFGSVTVESDCSTGTLTATANEGYRFVIWNDGNTDNPRDVTLTSDTAFTAIFAAIDESSLSEDVEVAKIGVYPNPISGFATMEFEALQEYSLLRIADLGGRVIKTLDLSAGTESVRLDLRDLPSGVYTLMIGNTTKKLIVE